MSLLTVLGPWGVLIFLYLVVVAFSALAIWVTSKLDLGLKVSGPFASIVASLVIVVIRFLVYFVLELIGTPTDAWWLEFLVDAAAAFIVLLAGSRIGKDIQVNGYGGALIASAAVAALTWLIGRIIVP